MSITRSIKLRKAGGSLIATIPKDVVDQRHLRAGDVVPVSFDDAEELWKELEGSIPGVVWDRARTRGRDRY